MSDLVCLVADKNIESAIRGILARHQALGVRAIDAEILVHPRRDPGCFSESDEILRGYPSRAEHALVVFDKAWEGSPGADGSELEELTKENLRSLPDDWVEIVVIDPELEAWVFSTSPHVEGVLGWAGRVPGLREALGGSEVWPAGAAKPTDPKAVVERALRTVKKPRSSSLYGELARKVSLERCQDRAFRRLAELLRRWFPADGETKEQGPPV